MFQSFRHTFFATFALLFVTFSVALAQEPAHDHEHKESKFNIGEMIMHHIADAHEWEFAHGVAIPLPVIIYDNGLKVFSSSNFYHSPDATHEDHENHVYPNKSLGYVLEHEHIYPIGADGKANKDAHVLDFSITKNVASLLLKCRYPFCLSLLRWPKAILKIKEKPLQASSRFWSRSSSLSGMRW